MWGTGVQNASANALQALAETQSAAGVPSHNPSLKLQNPQDSELCSFSMQSVAGRKRSLSLSTEQVLAESPSKRRRAGSSHFYPPRFWDTLSKVHLTRRAVREFDRRQSEDAFAPIRLSKATATKRRLLRSDTRRLKKLAEAGGLNLTALRGYSESASKANMSQSSLQSRKRSLASGTSGSSQKPRTRNTTPYSGEFELKLIDQGVFPEGYEDAHGHVLEPSNIEEIREVLAGSRASLSPSKFRNDSFLQFQRNNRRATKEAAAMAEVIPVITGSKDGEYPSGRTTPFHRLEKFDPDLSAPTPDIYYGARPSQIDRRVRHDLNRYVIPSNSTSLPAAPNFFLEGKSEAGRADIARRQAMHDGAAGARGMHRLQNYGQRTPTYDGNAYTITSTYCDGTLKMYATHPSAPLSTDDNPQYHMTQLDTYAMTGNINSFRQGAAAYRNARQWTKEQRDRLIADANGVSQMQSIATATVTQNSAGSSRRSPATTSLSTSQSHANVSGEESFSSETSTDELAPDYDAGQKRPRY